MMALSVFAGAPQGWKFAGVGFLGAAAFVLTLRPMAGRQGPTARPASLPPNLKLGITRALLVAWALVAVPVTIGFFGQVTDTLRAIAERRRFAQDEAAWLRESTTVATRLAHLSPSTRDLLTTMKQPVTVSAGLDTLTANGGSDMPSDLNNVPILRPASEEVQESLGVYLRPRPSLPDEAESNASVPLAPLLTFYLGCLAAPGLVILAFRWIWVGFERRSG